MATRKKCFLLCTAVFYLAFLGNHFSYYYLYSLNVDRTDSRVPDGLRVDRWREFVPNDTFIYSVHGIDSFDRVRFVVADLTEKREQMGLCCFHNANKTIIRITLFKHYRIPELETENRQVVTQNE